MTSDKKEKPKIHFSEHIPKDKDKKPIGFLLADTKDVAKYIENVFADTDEAIKKREEIEEKRELVTEPFKDIYKTFFITKRGEHAVHKKAPKTYAVENLKEAEELWLSLAKETYRQHKGEEDLETTLKSDVGNDKILNYFDQVVHQATDGKVNYKLIKKGVMRDKKYLHSMFKEHKLLDKLGYVEEDFHLNQAVDSLNDETKHRAGIESLVNKALEPHKKKFKSSADHSDMLNVLISHYKNNGLKKQHLKPYETVMEKYEPGK